MVRALLLHNPRCSKSRQALALLESAQVELEVRPYLEEPLSREELQGLASRLGGSVIEWTRTKEAAFKAAGLTLESSDSALIEAMLAHPVLMERPLLVIGERAIVARPPELVRELL